MLYFTVAPSVQGSLRRRYQASLRSRKGSPVKAGGGGVESAKECSSVAIQAMVSALPAACTTQVRAAITQPLGVVMPRVNKGAGGGVENAKECSSVAIQARVSALPTTELTTQVRAAITQPLGVMMPRVNKGAGGGVENAKECSSVAIQARVSALPITEVMTEVRAVVTRCHWDEGFFDTVDLANRLEAEARAARQGRIADYLTRKDFAVLDELGYLLRYTGVRALSWDRWDLPGRTSPARL
jgi:hypothetical protein